ncbi:MAG: uroporphyrinogen-III synthase [Pseudohongiella sp.]|nr:uroporphyrinogen-III synthase [Pseudohongiella sp.]
MTEQTLSGITVLLTRPVAQSATLAAALAALGANVCELPLIEIEPVTDSDACEQIKSMILNLDHYYAAIFISTNAAKIGMEWIDRFWPQLPTGLSAYAVGPGTAQVLNEFDWPVFVSDKGVTSEDLLALPGLRQVEGKKIALFRGVGGRELLAETLRERGATVDYLELYHRHTPHYSQHVLADLIRDQNVNAIVVSSAQILDVLLHSLHQDTAELRIIPLIVPSERVRQRALDAGLNIVINAGGADEASVIKSLRAIAPVIKPKT